MKKFLKIIKLFFLVSLALYLILFCLSNKETVKLTLPLSDFIFEANLYLLIITILLIGIVFGYIFFSLRRLPLIIKVRNLKKEVKLLNDKIDVMETDKKIDQQIRSESQKNIRSFSDLGL